MRRHGIEHILNGLPVGSSKLEAGAEIMSTLEQVQLRVRRLSWMTSQALAGEGEIISVCIIYSDRCHW